MSDVRYKIMFSGELMPDFDLAQVEQNLAQLFKSDIDKIRQLFSGKPVALKRDLSDDQAEKYLTALQRAGAKVSKENDLASALSLVATDDHPEPEPQAASASPAMQEQADDRMSCPKCGFEQPKAAECSGCGIIIEKFLARQAEFEASIQPATSSAASPYATPQAAVYDNTGEEGELKYLNFGGRIGRLRLLAWNLLLMVVGYLVIAVAGGMVIGDFLAPLGWLIGIAAFIASMVYSVSFSVQRLHDIGWSGWLVLLNFVPFVNIVFPFLMLFMPGTQGPNRFGPPPPANSTGVKVAAGIFIVILVIVPITMAISLPAYMAYMENAGMMSGEGMEGMEGMEGFDEEAFLEYQQQLEQQQ